MMERYRELGAIMESLLYPWCGGEILRAGCDGEVGVMKSRRVCDGELGVMESNRGLCMMESCL